MSHYVRIRRKEKPGDERGIVYLIHFDAPLIGVQKNPDAKKLGIAKHYLGWALNLDARLTEHRSGNGSRLMAAVASRGITWRVARTWENATRTQERRLKNQGSACKICPICKEAA
jgi:predicted GIY-YIG superfamily endonuclease